MRFFSFIISTFLFAGLTAPTAAQHMVKPADPRIQYTGRISVEDQHIMMSWSGTSLRINFEGSQVKAVLMDEYGENYYNVIVDGRVVNVLDLDKGKKEYTLVAGLKAGKHTLELFKRTEWVFGRTWIYGLVLENANTLLTAPVVKKRKMEFYGDSITCGYGVEDTTGQDRGASPYENAYKTYAAITARYFNADYHSISRSGIGLTISWFPQIMPEMYNKLDPVDEKSNWDFSKYIPDVIVINLFQNDAGLTKATTIPEYKRRFGNTAPTAEYIVNAYVKFIKELRSKHPKAHIICVLGNMDASQTGSEWRGYVKQAAAGLKDARVHSLIFPYKKTPGHPSAAEQQAMADDLIKFIKEKVTW
ncbi:electron transporter RnfD [Mucilaginibacter hurinus]|uniref:Electron transporter RnfD n=1 Tax=Mucilaginibacter hurinus TaxID=2201324 RepID=A0A367GSX6_9SPHI|nr:SGNH/GDSL hydrolase family protein [Mucilaginibacter hurinus]RCH55803.1 electron transporter RnfD [Mucilaginibacter hurinus]